MESVKKAKQRLRNYPVLIGKCAGPASSYAVCVTRDLDVQKLACDKEFQVFKKCLVDAAKHLKTKL